MERNDRELNSEKRGYKRVWRAIIIKGDGGLRDGQNEK